MKTLLPGLFLAVLLSAAPAQAEDRKPQIERDYDETSRFIFYSVLEGLYEDGLSKADVGQILMQEPGQRYFHFIYACPVCGPTIWALEAYIDKPEQFYGLKAPGSTFGTGLSEKLHAQLYSEDPRQRLAALNSLMQTWMERRMKLMRLTQPERVQLVKALEEKRQTGMNVLESFRKRQHGADFGVEQGAPAYVNLTECAVCNGAVGKPMKLPEAKPK